MKKRKKLIKSFITLLFLSIASVFALYVTCYFIGPPMLKSSNETVFLDQDKAVIDLATTQKEPVLLTDISPLLLDSVIIVEDKDFYQHHGFDFKGMLRAIVKNIRAAQLKEGASTITQQLARNLYLSHEKTWTRKIKEAIYTIRLEMFYTKEEILESYMNSIYYGHGAYGIEAASNLFFNKTAKELSLAEAAMLAGVPKGPTYYSPFNDLEKATERQQLILKLLVDQKQITSAQYYEAFSERLKFNHEKTDDNINAHYLDIVTKEASKLLNESTEDVLNSGYTIQTTLNPHLQKELHTTIKKHITPENTIEIGALSLQPEDGAVLALVGANPHHHSSYNHVNNAKRMVGSAFKPLLYYTALEHGYTPATTLMSEPTVFDIDEQTTYQPKNYNGYYANKPITLAEAIAVSDNIYAVKTNLFLTPKTVRDTIKKFGIKADLPAVPSLALGSAAISVAEMVNAYGIISNGGKQIANHTIESITTSDNKVIYQRENTEALQVLNRQKAFILTHLMTGMFDPRLNDYTEVTGSSIIPKLTKLYAGKSGTTDFDSWMIGYSPSIVTGVWVGYDDNRPLINVGDNAIAKDVWADFMEIAHQKIPENNFPIPNDIVWKMIDPESGLIATTNCPTSKLMYFEKGTEPIQVCEHHYPIEEENVPPETEKDNFFQRIIQFFS